MKVTYAALSAAFADIKDLDVKQVGDKIGGKVKINIDDGHFQNACALRLSYALNKVGVIITAQDGAVSSGADGKKYLYRIDDVEKLVKNKLIFPEILTGIISSDFKGKQGIIVFRGCGWSDAAGHIDLYDGTKVEDHDFSTKCGRITLYVLP